MMGMTEVQAGCFKYVRDRIAADGVAPSYREIANHLGLRSLGRVSKIIDELEKRGAVRRIEGKARALEVTEPGIGTGFVVNPVPEVRRAVQAYAREHGVSERTAAEEALRAYFVGAAAR